MSSSSPHDVAQIMGILNATPDSFSDGGAYAAPDAAARHAARLIAEGAQWIDIGAESTRPNAPEVSESEEWTRLAPVLEAVLSVAGDTSISVDTRRPTIAARALRLGARGLNDVSAQTHPEMMRLAHAYDASLALMHGYPASSVESNESDVEPARVRSVFASLVQRAKVATRKGLAASRLWLDPGLGFGKSSALSWALLDRLEELVRCGYPVLIGPSRKRFLRRLGEGPLTLEQRDERTAQVCATASGKGAVLVRVHDVQAVKRALRARD